MAVKKSDGGWLVDSQPGGRGGRRFRKTFKTQAEAKAYDAWLKTQVNQNARWAPEKRDRGGSGCLNTELASISGALWV